MWKAMKRWYRYRVAKTDRSFNAKADPAVQLEQAIAESQEQHRRLKEQAANVIANQKQAEMRLNRTMDDYEKLQTNTRQALIMADHAGTAGDTRKAAEYSTAAEAFANRLLMLESELEQSKQLALQASQASAQAKAAVATNSQALQKKLAERQKLLSQLDQAKMQEQMNLAMTTLNEVVGVDVPTFHEVQEKIEARYARAKGVAELTEQTVESHMLEIEQAAMNVEAQNRLSLLRAELGLADKPGELGTGTPKFGSVPPGTPGASGPVAETGPAPPPG